MNEFLKVFQESGAKAFTDLVTATAPYFSSIDPMITELKEGFAEVELKNQSKVHNHLGTVHAIAMCNAAELAAGMMTTVSIPSTARWIPKGMTVEYLAKAKTDLRVVTEADDLDFSAEGDLKVPVAAYDKDNTKVFTALITMNIKHS